MPGTAPATTPGPAPATAPATDPAAGPPPPPPADDPPEQRRVLLVLILSQILSGAGLAAGITVGALLAEEMLGSTSLAGLPAALFTGGAALGAVGVGRVCQRWGRRPGLASGYAVGALGSLGVVGAAAADSAPLLFVSLVVYGAGTSTNLLARYAGADLAPPERRGRAISTVLLATTLGAVAGPNLVTWSGSVAHNWDLPRLTGPFLLAAAAFTAAAVVLGCFLRPDPLLLARSRAAEAERTEQTEQTEGKKSEEGGEGEESRNGEESRDAEEGGEARDEAAASHGLDGAPAPAPSPTLTDIHSPTPTDVRALVTGTTVMVLTQLVMISVMTMTPVHMKAHGHGTQLTGLVIALHVGAMFLPSPLSGRLVDRLGPRPVAAAAGVTLLAAGCTAALAPPHSAAALAVALVLLGLGWNLGLLSGTAMVTAATPPSTRAATQGLVDVGIAVAGASGGLASGVVTASGGFPVLAFGGGVLALAVLPLVLVTARATHPRRPAGRPTRTDRRR
ncbi:MFS transporter [Streptomyces sp. NPDC017940]|uniref:MFS transporter n=1 Tax=Streptomyces sp. NPDC017940 TaxID=3365017 RepID=UPI0037ADAF4A